MWFLIALLYQGNFYPSKHYVITEEQHALGKGRIFDSCVDFQLNICYLWQIMSESKNFGQLIREFRLAKKLSQRELADRVAARLKEEDLGGFNFTYLSKIENNRLPPPSISVIIQLATELEADSDELIALAGKTPPDVGEALKKSEGARAFFRSAINHNLSENDWKKLLENIKKNEK